MVAFFSLRIQCGMILALLLIQGSYSSSRTMTLHQPMEEYQQEVNQAVTSAPSPSLLLSSTTAKPSVVMTETTLVPSPFNTTIADERVSSIQGTETPTSFHPQQQRFWQWPLQSFRILFIERPDNDLVLEGRFKEYLTQQLYTIYLDVLVDVQVQLVYSHMDWIQQLFVYDFSGYAIMALPPRTEEDVFELHRLQQMTLSNRDALHEFWDNEPVLAFVPPPMNSNKDHSNSSSSDSKNNRMKWIWSVIAAISFGAMIIFIVILWVVWDRHRAITTTSAAGAATTTKSTSVQIVPPLDDDDVEDPPSVAWSSPLGKIIPTTWYFPSSSLDHIRTTIPPALQDGSHTMDTGMSACTPIQAPVHQFITDSILMDECSDLEDDEDPTMPNRRKRSSPPTEAVQWQPRQSWSISSDPQDDALPPVALLSSSSLLLLSVPPQELKDNNFDGNVQVQQNRLHLQDDHPMALSITLDSNHKTLFVKDSDDDNNNNNTTYNQSCSSSISSLPSDEERMNQNSILMMSKNHVTWLSENEVIMKDK